MVGMNISLWEYARIMHLTYIYSMCCTWRTINVCRYTSPPVLSQAHARWNAGPFPVLKTSSLVLIRCSETHKVSINHLVVFQKSYIHDKHRIFIAVFSPSGKRKGRDNRSWFTGSVRTTPFTSYFKSTASVISSDLWVPSCIREEARSVHISSSDK